MARPYLVLLLLLNYLLVVGAGMAERPARAVDRPTNYAHSHDCQQRNYLRVSCFDSCNGVQYTIRKTGERPPLTQLLSSLKGLDSHCLPEAAAAVSGAPAPRRAAPDYPAGRSGAPVAFHHRIELPPRQG